MRHPGTLAGVALLMGALACFASLDTTTKFITQTIPVWMAIWFRYSFQALATSITVLPRRGRDLLRTQHPKYQLLRGGLLLLSSLLVMLSLKYLPMAELTAIIMITPLVINALAAYQLREKVSLLRWALTGGGFLGTLIIIRPDSHFFGWATLLPLGLVASNAWFQVLTSQMARTEDAMTMQFYTGWVGTLCASVVLPFVWVAPPDVTHWAGLLFMGLAATVGHFLLIQAYRRASAVTLTPFLYTQIAFAMFGGWLVFSQVPDAWSLVGIALIAVCGALGAWLVRREGRVAIEPVET